MQHEDTILRKYHEALSEGGVDIVDYSFEELKEDYDASLWMSAVLYALPGIYDRGTTTEENAEAAKTVGLALGRNLRKCITCLSAYRQAICIIATSAL